MEILCYTEIITFSGLSEYSFLVFCLHFYFRGHTGQLITIHKMTVLERRGGWVLKRASHWAANACKCRCCSFLICQLFDECWWKSGFASVFSNIYEDEEKKEWRRKERMANGYQLISFIEELSNNLRTQSKFIVRETSKYLTSQTHYHQCLTITSVNSSFIVWQWDIYCDLNMYEEGDALASGRGHIHYLGLG